MSGGIQHVISGIGSSVKKKREGFFLIPSRSKKPHSFYRKTIVFQSSFKRTIPEEWEEWYLDTGQEWPSRQPSWLLFVRICVSLCFFQRYFVGVQWSLSKIFSLVQQCPSLRFGFSREFFLEIFSLVPLVFLGCHLLQHLIWDKAKRQLREYTALSFFGSWGSPQPTLLFSTFQKLL